MASRIERQEEHNKALSLKKNYTVYEPNPLLSVQDNMTNVWQHRFMRAYLCKVDPRNPDSFRVQFSLQEFLEAVDLQGVRSVSELKKTARSMMKVDFDFVEYRERYGLKKKGSEALIDVVNLFERFTITGSDTSGYVVTVVPTRPMEEMLRNCQQKNGVGFVSYEIGNTLPMSKPHRMRLYELLKRSEDRGYMTIPLEDLKLFMGLKDKYADVRHFNRLLKADLAEINENTDLQVTYTTKGKGKGGAIFAYNFTVKSKAASKDTAAEKPKATKAPKPQKPLKGQTSLFIQEEDEPPYISLIRGNLSRGSILTTEEIDLLYAYAKQSLWAQNIPFHYGNQERNLKIAEYIQFQEKYTLAHLEYADSYKSYLQGAVRENWGNMAPSF